MSISTNETCNKQYKYSSYTTKYDPFSPSYLITNGDFSETPALILTDDGDEINQISKEFCRSVRIELRKENYEAKMANSTK